MVKAIKAMLQAIKVMVKVIKVIVKDVKFMEALVFTFGLMAASSFH